MSETKSLIHINLARIDAKHISHRWCPDCCRNSYFINWFQEWYGWKATCMRCGRQFAEGEWMPLPFQRGIREDNKKYARQTWRGNYD